MIGRQTAWMGSIDLHLNGRVADVEVGVEALGYASDESVSRMAHRHDEMNGKRVVGCAHSPNMEIMNFGDTWRRGEEDAHPLDLDALRYRL
jgi:hypothetical protein